MASNLQTKHVCWPPTYYWCVCMSAPAQDFVLMTQLSSFHRIYSPKYSRLTVQPSKICSFQRTPSEDTTHCRPGVSCTSPSPGFWAELKKENIESRRKRRVQRGLSKGKSMQKTSSEIVCIPLIIRWSPGGCADRSNSRMKPMQGVFCFGHGRIRTTK